LILSIDILYYAITKLCWAYQKEAWFLQSHLYSIGHEEIDRDGNGERDMPTIVHFQIPSSDIERSKRFVWVGVRQIRSDPVIVISKFSLNIFLSSRTNDNHFLRWIFGEVSCKNVFYHRVSE
jgi:hypothetical protein